MILLPLPSNSISSQLWFASSLKNEPKTDDKVEPRRQLPLPPDRHPPTLKQDHPALRLCPEIHAHPLVAKKLPGPNLAHAPYLAHADRDPEAGGLAEKGRMCYGSRWKMVVEGWSQRGRRAI